MMSPATSRRRVGAALFVIMTGVTCVTGVTGLIMYAALLVADVFLQRWLAAQSGLANASVRAIGCDR
jgi:hypothetical protein